MIRFLHFLVSLILIIYVDSYSQHTTKNNYTGDWSTSTSWTVSWATPQTSGISQNITINGYIQTSGAISFGGSGGDLVINDTLIVNGDLNLGNNNNIVVNNGGVLIVRGNLTIDNNVDIAANAYIVVTGNFTKGGAANKGSFTSDDSPSNVFIGGTITVPGTWGTGAGNVLDCTGVNDYDNSGCNYGNVIDLSLNPIGEFVFGSCTPKPNITSITSNSPVLAGSNLNLIANGDPGTGGTWPLTYIWSGPLSYSASGSSVSRTSTTVAMTGYYKLLLKNANGCFSQDSVFGEITSSSCCVGSSYASKDNYTGAWTNVNSWATPDESWRPLPPPTNPMNTQSLCINGYITLTGSLTINGGNQKICDTLVITGDLNLNSYSFNVTSTGVLIVLGNFTGSSGSLTNSGRVVVVSDITNPYSSSISGTGSFYVFDDTPNIQGFTPTGDETTLATSDPSLSNFVNSMLCGTFNGGTIGSSQSKCSGVDVDAFTNIAAANPGSGISYQWYYSTNSSNPTTGTWNSISGATSATYDHGTLAQTTYFYRKAIKSGVCTANSNVLTITITPSATINAFSPATSSRCQGTGTVTYTTTANNSTGITYNLDAASITGGNTINSTTGEVTFNSGWSGTTTITASAAGCNGPATTTHVVTIYPLPSPSITGINNVCEGENGSYSTTNNTGNSYAWTVTNGTIQSGQGTYSITILWNSVGAVTNLTGGLTVTETSAAPAGCTYTTPDYSVTIHRVPDTGPQYHIPNP